MIVLPGIPMSTQHIYGRRGSFTFMKPEAKNLKESYAWEAKKAWMGKKPMRGPIAVWVKVYHKVNRPSGNDVDNFNKLWQDALNGIVYEDDSQIVISHNYKLHDKIRPRIEVEIQSINES